MPSLRPVVITGPSGAGKSTLIKLLMKNYPYSFEFSVSHTTRKPRPDEVHGKDYLFVERDQMLEDIKNGKFLECSEFAGNYYATPREAIASILERGKICILDVDANAVRKIHAIKPPLNALFICICPPSIEILEQRLRDRGTETEEKIQSRIKQAKIDMDFAQSAQGKSIYDAYIVNDNLDEAYEQLYNLLKDDIALTLPCVKRVSALFCCC